MHLAARFAIPPSLVSPFHVGTPFVNETSVLVCQPFRMMCSDLRNKVMKLSLRFGSSEKVQVCIRRRA